MHLYSSIMGLLMISTCFLLFSCSKDDATEDLTQNLTEDEIALTNNYWVCGTQKFEQIVYAFYKDHKYYCSNYDDPDYNDYDHTYYGFKTETGKWTLSHDGILTITNDNGVVDKYTVLTITPEKMEMYFPNGKRVKFDSREYGNQETYIGQVYQVTADTYDYLQLSDTDGSFYQYYEERKKNEEKIIEVTKGQYKITPFKDRFHIMENSCEYHLKEVHDDLIFVSYFGSEVGFSGWYYYDEDNIPSKTSKQDLIKKVNKYIDKAEKLRLEKE